MGNSTWGYTGWVSEMTAPASKGRSKWYKVYEIRNETDANDVRYLFHYGVGYGDGKYQLATSYTAATNKIFEKSGTYDSEYTLIRNREPVPDFGRSLLERAGINVASMQRRAQLAAQQQATAVESSALATFISSLSSLMEVLHGQDLTPEMVAAYRKLRTQFADIQREVQDAEGRMELLTALISRKFEGA